MIHVVANPCDVPLLRISSGSATASKMAKIWAIRSSFVIPGQMDGGVGAIMVGSTKTGAAVTGDKGTGGVTGGATTGAVNGATLGATLGSADNVATGVTVGAIVDPFAGLAMGDKLGMELGTELGNSLGLSLGTSLGDVLGGLEWSQVG